MVDRPDVDIGLLNICSGHCAAMDLISSFAHETSSYFVAGLEHQCL